MSLLKHQTIGTNFAIAKFMPPAISMPNIGNMSIITHVFTLTLPSVYYLALTLQCPMSYVHCNDSKAYDMPAHHTLQYQKLARPLGTASQNVGVNLFVSSAKNNSIQAKRSALIKFYGITMAGHAITGLGLAYSTSKHGKLCHAIPCHNKGLNPVGTIIADKNRLAQLLQTQRVCYARRSVSLIPHCVSFDPLCRF